MAQNKLKIKKRGGADRAVPISSLKRLFPLDPRSPFALPAPQRGVGSPSVGPQATAFTNILEISLAVARATSLPSLLLLSYVKGTRTQPHTQTETHTHTHMSKTTWRSRWPCFCCRVVLRKRQRRTFHNSSTIIYQAWPLVRDVTAKTGLTPVQCCSRAS